MWVTLLFVISVFAGCGKKPVISEEDTEKKSSPLSEREDVQLFYADVKRINTQCAENLCPQGVVFIVSRLFSANSNEYIYCSGLIISENKVVVPSECLADRFLKAGKACDDSILARDFNSKEIFKCSEVVSIGMDKENKSTPETWKNDFVVLEFENLPIGKSYTIPSRLGLYENRKYSVWGYRYDGLNEVALLQSKSCYVQYENYIQPLGKNPYSPNLSLTSCLNPREKDQVLNSSDLGAIVFSEKRHESFKALGIISYITDFISGEIDYSSDFMGAALVQNFTCFEYLLKSKKKNLPRACKAELSKRLVEKNRARQLRLRRSSKSFQRNFNLVKEDYNSNDRYLRWGVLLEDFRDQISLSPKPECFHRVKEWIGDLKDQGDYRWYEYKRPIRWTTYKISPAILPTGRIDHLLNETGVVSYRLNFVPKRVRKKGYSLVGGFLSRDIRISVCN